MYSPLRAVLVGLGHRTRVYASYSERHPDQMVVVAAADPDPQRLAWAKERFNLAPESCFTDAASLAAAGQLGEIAINGTMDEIHVETSIPLLEAGYDLLLEKPIAPDADELRRLTEMAGELGRNVIICHVLRHAPFYAAIKQRLLDGEIGELASIHSLENVSYHHMAAAFVRGKWNRRAVNPMLLAKCCHDLDLLVWMNSQAKPLQVASFGGRHFFRAENAPTGAGTRCLLDCDIERECDYSAARHYLEMGLWEFYAFKPLERLNELTAAEKREQLSDENNPLGRCVWNADNDVVDRQSVLIEFENGCVATHQMVGTAARATRKLHLIGTEGEIEGDLLDGCFTIRHPHPRQGGEWKQEVVQIDVHDDPHGGGDLRLVEDFLHIVRGESTSICTTTLEDSIHGHLIAYAADVAMLEKRVVTI